MKSLKVVMLVGLAAVGLAGCGECQHVDDNKDHLCDKCGVRISDCKDEQPQDHLCDYCGTKMSDCKDDNHDHNCDICGKQLSEHVDSDHSGECDICGTPMEVHHKDEDGDGHCDVCGIEIKVESFVYDDTLAQRTYVVGEAFNGAGVTVTAVTTDEKEVSIPVSFKLPDMTTPGSGKVVEVSFVINGVEEKRTFNIDILYWDAESIALLDYYTLVGYYGGVYLPYISGLEAVEDEVAGEFYLSKENATVEDLKLYGNLMKELVDIEGPDGCTYSFVQLEDVDDALELYGFERCYAFYCVPSYVDEEGYDERQYIMDEYVVVGLTEGGDLKVYIRDVFALLDGYMAGNENLSSFYDVELIRKAGLTPDYFYAAAADLPGYYCTSLAASQFVFPEYEGATGIIGLTSLKTYYPFFDFFDEYLIVEEIELMGGTQAEFDGFVAELLAYGYEATRNEDGGFTDYEFSDPYVGDIRYRVFDYDPHYVSNTYSEAAVAELGADEGYEFYLYYTSPVDFGSRYMNSFSAELDEITGSLIAEEEIIVGEYYAEYEAAGDLYDGMLGAIAPAGEVAPTVAEAFEVRESNISDLYVLEDAGVDYDFYENEYQYKIFNNGTFGVEIDVYTELSQGLRLFEVYVFEGEETMDTLAQKVAVTVSPEDVPAIQSGNHYRTFNLDAGDSSARTFSDVLGEFTNALSGMFTFGAVTEDSEVYTVVGEEANFGFILTIDVSDVNGSWVARFTLSDKPFVGGAKLAAEAVVAEIAVNYEIEVEATKLMAGVYSVTINGSESVAQDQFETLCIEAANQAIENALPYGYQVISEPAYSASEQCYFAYATSKDGMVTYVIYADATLDDPSQPTESTISSKVEILVENTVWTGTDPMKAIQKVGSLLKYNFGLTTKLTAYYDGSYDTDLFTVATGLDIFENLDELLAIINSDILPVLLEDILPAGSSLTGGLWNAGNGMYGLTFISYSRAVAFDVIFGFGQESATTLYCMAYVVSYPTPKGTLYDVAMNYYSNLYNAFGDSVTPAYDSSTDTYILTGIGMENIPDASVTAAVTQLKNVVKNCAPYAYGSQQASYEYSAGDGWVAVDYVSLDANATFTYTFMYKVTQSGEGVNTIEVKLYVYLTPFYGTAEEAIAYICLNSKGYLDSKDVQEDGGVYSVSSTVAASVPEANKDSVLGQAANIALGALPIGCVQVGSSGDTKTYVTADGSVTIQVTIEAVSAGEGIYDIVVSVSTFETPAE